MVSFKIPLILFVIVCCVGYYYNHKSFYVSVRQTREDYKVELVRWYTELDPFMAITLENNKRYAQIHNYTIHQHYGRLLPHENWMWDKSEAILRSFDDNTPNQWLVWIDGDMLFTNMEYKYEDFIEHYSTIHPDRNATIDLIIARDTLWHANGLFPLNSGGNISILTGKFSLNISKQHFHNVDYAKLPF